MAVKLIIDSASDINEKEAKELGIGMIPMSITFGDEEFLDGVNLLPQQFYEKLISGNVLPKTSQINAYRFEQKFEKYTQNDDDLIVITISSKLSGTYNSGKAMGAKNGYNLLNKIVDEKGGIDFKMPFGAIWSGLSNSALQKYIQYSALLWQNGDNVQAYILGGTIGTHIGPGAVGLAFFEK